MWPRPRWPSPAPCRLPRPLSEHGARPLAHGADRSDVTRQYIVPTTASPQPSAEQRLSLTLLQLSRFRCIAARGRSQGRSRSRPAGCSSRSSAAANHTHTQPTRSAPQSPMLKRALTSRLERRNHRALTFAENPNPRERSGTGRIRGHASARGHTARRACPRTSLPSPTSSSSEM
eukprot:COSAG04_NODE_12833_length_631_cov_1.692308_1_plen_174_part_10